MSSAANLYPAPGAAPFTAAPLTSASALKPSVAAQGAAIATSSASSEKPQAAESGGGKSKLIAFEGFLKKAGQIAGVVLTDVLKYVIPIASIVSVADPAAAPAVEAFTASIKLVQATVVSVQQRWAAEGSSANSQKLADVLAIVEQPIVTMFSQAGMQVDTAYVTNLVNGVVAILNAQPAAVIPAAV